MDELNQTVDIGNLSKFNSGALINMRLNNLWVDSHTHKRNGKYLSWNGDLDAVWCELGGDVKEEDESNKKYNEIEEQLSKLSPILNWNSHGQYDNLTTELKLLQNKQYRILIKKELFLRRLQNKQGKGTAYDDEEDWE